MKFLTSFVVAALAVAASAEPTFRKVHLAKREAPNWYSDPAFGPSGRIPYSPDNPAHQAPYNPNQWPTNNPLTPSCQSYVNTIPNAWDKFQNTISQPGCTSDQAQRALNDFADTCSTWADQFGQGFPPNFTPTGSLADTSGHVYNDFAQRALSATRQASALGGVSQDGIVGGVANQFAYPFQQISGVSDGLHLHLVASVVGLPVDINLVLHLDLNLLGLVILHI